MTSHILAMTINPVDLISDLQKVAPDLELYSPQDPRSKESQEFYNRALTYQPLAIAKPRTEDQVSSVVRFCTTHGTPLAVRSAGHDFFGRSQVNNGILIDMRTMDTIEITPDSASARLGGGVIAGNLQQTLNSRGLFTPTGQAKSVGYVSWACGGGYGFYVGTYGFGVDQILGARVVLASGEIVDTREDPELLWALRGAGAGAFGVLVELRVRVYPAPTIYAGLLAFPLSQTAEVFRRFQELIPDGYPDEFSGDSLFAHPEMLPVTLSEPCLTFLWCWTAVDGNLMPAKCLLEKMTGLGTVLANTVEETTAADFGADGSPSRTFFRSRNVKGLQPELGTLVELLPPPQPLSTVVVHNNHGKGVREGISDGIGTSFKNRYQHVILGLHGGTKDGVTTDSKEYASATDWVKELENCLDEQKLSLQAGFANFHPPENVDLDRFFDQDIVEKLQGLKRRLDPGNVFCKSLPELQ
ncbi:hypothetical protein BDV12DRAFT_10217 [Aspergillus spectabilis]